jgi:hypothetical protein
MIARARFSTLSPAATKGPLSAQEDLGPRDRADSDSTHFVKKMRRLGSDLGGEADQGSLPRIRVDLRAATFVFVTDAVSMRDTRK